MKEQLQERIEQLGEEYQAGEAMLADLDRRRTEVQATMLRISGALQVLRELLGPAAAVTPPECETPMRETTAS